MLFKNLKLKILCDHSINLCINPLDIDRNIFYFRNKWNLLTEKDSSDDENDLFSSDHLGDKQSVELFYNKADTKFKNGEEDFKITTGSTIKIFLQFHFNKKREKNKQNLKLLYRDTILRFTR